MIRSSGNKSQKENIMPFQYKLSDVIKNTTMGTISATVLERVKIEGQVYQDEP